MKTLHCSCCGSTFNANQQFEGHDRGYGTCSKCCDWILSRADWADDHSRIKRLMTIQWPKMAQNKSWPVPRKNKPKKRAAFAIKDKATKTIKCGDDGCLAIFDNKFDALNADTGNNPVSVVSVYILNEEEYKLLN